MRTMRWGKWKSMTILTLLTVLMGIVPVSASEVISSLVLSKNEVSLEVGKTASLTATAIYESGDTESVAVKTDWNSGSPDIASVYAGTITAKKEGTATITATYMGETVVVQVTVTKHVRSLIKDVQTLDLRKGQAQQVALTAYYDDGTTEDVTAKAEWNIEDGTVATVVNGLVTGQSAGSTVVTAEYNNQTVSIPTKVEIVKRVDADTSQVSLLLNESQTVHLNATYPDGSVLDVTDQADWESDNPQVADVLKGKITGYSSGEAQITATYGTKSAAISVDVDRTLKLELNKQTLYMKKNASEQLALTATYLDGSTEDITSRADWSSSDESIAAVAEGQVVAKAIGEATLTARYGEQTVTATVDVGVPRRLAADPESLDLQTGQVRSVVLTASYADGTSENVSAKAAWSSDNAAVADADETGQITAYKSGTANLTAAYGGKSVTVPVSVDIPILLTPNKTKLSFQVGDYEQVVLKALFTDGRETDVTRTAEWSSSSPDTADVRSGMISGAAVGGATITAKYGTRTAAIAVSVGVVKSLTTTGDSTLSLHKDDTRQLDLTAVYTDGTSKDAAADAEWSSSNEKIVSVDGGSITALASGEATITASFGSRSVTVLVQVDRAKSLAANPTFLSFDLGETRSVSLSALDAEGNSRDVTSEAEWTAADTKIAQVSSAGVVTPATRGKTTVTAKYGGETLSIPVEIGIAQTLELDKKILTLKSGQSASVTLTSSAWDGSERDVSSEADWKSSNYKVVDVTDGTITAVASGKATVTASFGGKTVSLSVQVDDLKYLKTDQVVVHVNYGETVQLKATATYTDLTEEDVTVPSLWTSSSLRIADVKDGLIRAIGKGRATITVTYGNKKTYVYVTVD